ncbi:hypothetical protein M2271_006934 [Streptomyces sp. LBL]|nr:hypothetical protein [Streptomyces sp. LBL]
MLFVLFDRNGLPVHLPTLARNAVHLPDAGDSTTDTTSIPAAPRQFMRIHHRTGQGLRGTRVFDRGHGARDDARNDAEYGPANSRVPRPCSTRDGIATAVSAVARSSVDGGTNT